MLLQIGCIMFYVEDIYEKFFLMWKFNIKISAVNSELESLRLVCVSSVNRYHSVCDRLLDKVA